ncbi:MAG: glycolate oxidase subunit GlcE [Mariprofundus sp.]|nr:glycolate oxidase subunit GlcE [Mariprofundus sp.]
MRLMPDFSQQIQQQVEQAFQHKTALNIVGGNSKSWYGREATGEPLDVAGHSGIVTYQPTELIFTAKAGTPLSELADAMDEHKQRLPFDPPYFGETATLGGTVACGFSGPRRPYAGSCRDFILGCRIINGKGEILRFGGEVMKNVAGFDLSRLMAGSLGTLGVLLDISMKILPHRQAEQTLTVAADHAEAIGIMNRWAASPLPITGMASDASHVYFRICGTASAVDMSRQQIGGEIYADGLNFWKDVREHGLPFFNDARPLWRLSVPPATAYPIIADTQASDWFIGWGGAQRWLKSDLPAQDIFDAAQAVGGHATLFRGGDCSSNQASDVFAPLSSAHMQIHKNLKQAFDPHGILNPGRLYEGL